MSFIIREIGWIFVYIFVFGLSHHIAQNYLNNDYHRIVYFVFVGLLGAFIIQYSSKSRR